MQKNGSSNPFKGGKNCRPPRRWQCRTWPLLETEAIQPN